MVEKDGYLYVTGYKSNKVIVFEVMDKGIVRMGEITHNSLKEPEGIEVREDKLLISSNAGGQNDGGNIWEVTLRPKAVQGRTPEVTATALGHPSAHSQKFIPPQLAITTSL